MGNMPDVMIATLAVMVDTTSIVKWVVSFSSSLGH